MILFFNVLFNITVLLFVYTKKKKFVYFFPIIAILYDALHIFLGTEAGYTFQGYKILMYAILLMFFFFDNTRFLKINIWIIVFILYLSILIIFSGLRVEAFSGIIPVSITLLMFPIGYYYINDFDKLKKINYSITITGVIFVANFFIANAFSLGQDPYGLSLYQGSLHREHTFIASLFIVLIPLIVTTNNKLNYKWINYLFGFLCAVILMMYMRRGAILLFSTGLLVLYLYVITKKKKYFIRLIPLFALVIVLYATYSDQIIYRFLERGVNMAAPVDEFEETPRTLELQVIIENTLSFNNVSESLFGNQIFNFSETVGRYAGGRFGGRNIHTALGLFLFGTGIVGLFLFLMVLKRNISLYFINTKRSEKTNAKFIIIKGTFWALICMTFVDFYTKSFFFTTYAPALFLYQGALLRLLKENPIKT